MRHYNLVIGGESVESVSRQRFDVINPADSIVIGSVPDGTPEDVTLAMDAALSAFNVWSALSAESRAEYMHRCADAVRSRTHDIAVTLTLEQGKPLNDSIKEVTESAAAIDFFAEEGKRLRGELIPGDTADVIGLVAKRPVGVCVAITPWNYPVSLLSWKVGPALAAGCTVVAKPSSDTPLSSIEFAKCFAESDCPRGIVNVVTGGGGSLSRALIENPISRKIALTGSSEVGMKVAELAGRCLKRVSLELGGHSPCLVFGDCDLELAAREAVRRSFRNMGQICNAVNRVFVHASVADAFVDMFVDAARKLTIANGLHRPDADLGPMVNEEGVSRTLRHVQDALSRGATLLWGGTRPEGEEFERGFFLQPAILTNVPDDALIMSEETFGPAVAISTFSATGEAIRLANATRYGLVAYAYTRDSGTMNVLAHELDFGTVCINNSVAASLQAPYGGWKDSGLGIELSHRAMDEYVRLKHVRIRCQL